MKLRLLSLFPAFLLLVLSAQGQQKVLRPPFLKPGDRVAVISPSSTPEKKTVEAGCDILRQWGYEPVVGRYALADYHGFAGTREMRTSDLLWALRDTTIRAIMCTRGGDGAVQLLPYVKAKEFRSNPKWLIGFSDITALHSAFVQAGVMSIHGSMCQAISSQGGTDTVSVVLRQLLEGHLPVYHVEPHELDQRGTAEGVLVGGNFSVFCALAGSPYDSLNRAHEGLILFIEDTDEEMTKIDRLLHLLEVRGVLGRLKGILIGHFTKYKHPENGFEDMYQMLHEYLQHYPIPVCYGFPVGHKRPNFPLIEGGRVRMTVNKDGTQLSYLTE